MRLRSLCDKIYCKKKELLQIATVLLMEMREVESLIPVSASCASLHAAPFAVARIRAGFSSRWSALTPLRDSLCGKSLGHKKRTVAFATVLSDGDEGSRIPYLLHAMQAL